ncbi:MAG: hypothetical protein V4726_12350 [Verrucomicrobiota bacterium]
MKPFSKAVQRYEALIDDLAEDTHRHFGAIGDPNMEGVRFHTFEKLSGSFNYSGAVELGANEVDGIEEDLMRADDTRTLLLPMLAKLKSVAPAFNRNGKTVFLGSWGMGPGEIGWMIRRINDRGTFERYLELAGIPEAAVDAYNGDFGQDLIHVEQNGGGDGDTPRA